MRNNMAESGITTASIIVKHNESVQPYEFGNFISNEVNQTPQMQEVATLTDKTVMEQTNENMQVILDDIKNLQNAVLQVNHKVNIIEQEGVRGKDLDQQIVEAMKDLKNYSAFFEQATFQIETKVLKTAISIAKKIIDIEVSQNSAEIAKQTITNILDKIKTASKVTIHLNPKDYVMLKDQLNFGEFVSLQEDQNVTPGGVVIASDMGNFDGNVDVKVKTMLESLDVIA